MTSCKHLNDRCVSSTPSLSSIVKYTLSFALLLSPTIRAEAAPAWESVGLIDGVAVERAEIADSSLMAFRGQIEVPVSLAKLIYVFRRPDERRHWVNRYHSHQTLEKTQRSELYRIRFKLPPLVSDRDYVLFSKAELDAERREIRVMISSVEDERVPVNDCCVRAEVRRTFYRFTMLSPTRTRLEVEVHTDPKGSLPSWFVNLIQRKWPANTLTSLIARAEEVNRSDPSIEEWMQSLTQ